MEVAFEVPRVAGDRKIHCFALIQYEIVWVNVEPNPVNVPVNVPDTAIVPDAIKRKAPPLYMIVATWFVTSSLAPSELPS
jgi:hypothetical protein